MRTVQIFLKNNSRTVLKCVSGAVLVGMIAVEKISKKRSLNRSELVFMTREVTPLTITSPLSVLESEGVCVLHQAISTQGLQDCKQMESFRVAEQAKENLKTLKTANFWQSTPGRFHLQSFSQGDSSLLSELEHTWLPLVNSYLPTRGDISPHRSDLQLLVSLPQSKDQFFHQDNRRQGLTVLIPLVDVTLNNGPTQLVPGSHNLTAGVGEQVTSMDCSLMACMMKVQGSLRACLPAGSAIIYDSRTLHRGLANMDPSQSRPVLVFRYDYKDTPPPGHTVTSTNIFRILGNTLCVIGELKQRVRQFL